MGRDIEGFPGESYLRILCRLQCSRREGRRAKRQGRLMTSDLNEAVLVRTLVYLSFNSCADHWMEKFAKGARRVRLTLRTELEPEQ